MKKLISVLLLAVLLLQATAVGSFAASDAYKATWTLKASVMDAAAKQADDKAAYQNATGLTVYDSTKSPTVSVYPGQVVWVTMHLKTGASYYVGAMQGLIYYSSGIFESTKQSHKIVTKKGQKRPKSNSNIDYLNNRQHRQNSFIYLIFGYILFDFDFVKL